jgi:hypothetical protein
MTTSRETDFLNTVNCILLNKIQHAISSLDIDDYLDIDGRRVIVAHHLAFTYLDTLHINIKILT